jgi:predicted lysophospholipase L1 biosynthesis ABC-type transport system permease subunit
MVTQVRWIRWGLGILLVGLILGAEIEEGHGIHILMIVVSCFALAGVAWFYQDKPRLSILFAGIGVFSFLVVAYMHFFAADWESQWTGWLALVLLGFISVFLGRRFFQEGRRP